MDEIDALLKDLLEKINRKVRFDDIEHIVISLLEKDKEIKETMKTGNCWYKLTLFSV